MLPDQLHEIACVRHCIVHDAGIPRDSKHRDTIYALETRKWQGRPVGLQIDRYQGKDVGSAMTLDQRFLEYCLSVLEHFFCTLGMGPKRLLAVQCLAFFQGNSSGDQERVDA